MKMMEQKEEVREMKHRLDSDYFGRNLSFVKEFSFNLSSP